MRVHVNDEVCQGHGLCHMTAPDIFLLRDEDGQAYVDGDWVPDDRSPDAELGAASCPERAIAVS